MSACEIPPHVPPDRVVVVLGVVSFIARDIVNNIGDPFEQLGGRK